MKNITASKTINSIYLERNIDLIHLQEIHTFQENTIDNFEYRLIILNGTNRIDIDNLFLKRTKETSIFNEIDLYKEKINKEKKRLNSIGVKSSLLLRSLKTVILNYIYIYKLKILISNLELKLI